MSSSSKTYQASEVARHTTKEDLWIIIHGKVYDVTKYLEDHPGGVDAVLEVAGKDATAAYEDVGHSEDAREVMDQFLIGSLQGASEQADTVGTKKITPSAIVQVNQGPMPSSPDQQIVLRYIAMGLPATAILLYESIGYLRSENINRKQGDFWTGFVISGIIGALGVAFALYEVQKLTDVSKDWSQYPNHMKPTKYATVRSRRGVLDPTVYQSFQISQISKISDNVKLFVLQLPMKSSVLGLPCGQHIGIRCEVDGKKIIRSYTPVSNNTDLGELRLAIKIYKDGALTGGYLDKLQVGDSLEIRGPKGTMRYRKGYFRHIGMVAGGTGITPMYQIIRAIAEDPEDDTDVSLILANKTEQDIILKNDLDKWTKMKSTIKIYYVLDQPPKEWKYGTGHVDKKMIQERLAPASKDTQIMICGPPGLVKATQENLKELGFAEANSVSQATDQIFLF